MFLLNFGLFKTIIICRSYGINREICNLKGWKYYTTFFDYVKKFLTMWNHIFFTIFTQKFRSGSFNKKQWWIITFKFMVITMLWTFICVIHLSNIHIISDSLPFLLMIFYCSSIWKVEKNMAHVGKRVAHCTVKWWRIFFYCQRYLRNGTNG